jgi:Raf kinase inhibitor-like YbhB/YbcL family protein
MCVIKHLLPIALLLALGACSSPSALQPAPATSATPAASPEAAVALPIATPAPSALTLMSPAFAEGGTIAIEYTCDGVNRSPALNWSAPPPGTQSLVLIMEDPDASDYTHWVLFNMPPETRELAPGIADGEVLAGLGMHGQNGFANPGYGGPCPDPGDTHRYHFTLYAVDRMLSLDPAPTSPVSKGMVRDAMQGHTLAEASLTAFYTRAGAP